MYFVVIILLVCFAPALQAMKQTIVLKKKNVVYQNNPGIPSAENASKELTLMNSLCKGFTADLQQRTSRSCEKNLIDLDNKLGDNTIDFVLDLNDKTSAPLASFITSNFSGHRVTIDFKNEDTLSLFETFVTQNSQPIILVFDNFTATFKQLIELAKFQKKDTELLQTHANNLAIVTSLFQENLCLTEEQFPLSKKIAEAYNAYTDYNIGKSNQKIPNPTSDDLAHDQYIAACFAPLKSYYTGHAFSQKQEVLLSDTSNQETNTKMIDDGKRAYQEFTTAHQHWQKQKQQEYDQSWAIPIPTKNNKQQQQRTKKQNHKNTTTTTSSVPEIKETKNNVIDSSPQLTTTQPNSAHTTDKKTRKLVKRAQKNLTTAYPDFNKHQIHSIAIDPYARTITFTKNKTVYTLINAVKDASLLNPNKVDIQYHKRVNRWHKNPKATLQELAIPLEKQRDALLCHRVPLFILLFSHWGFKTIYTDKHNCSIPVVNHLYRKQTGEQKPIWYQVASAFLPQETENDPLICYHQNKWLIDSLKQLLAEKEELSETVKACLHEAFAPFQDTTNTRSEQVQ